LLAACDELQKQYLDVPWRIQSPDDIAEGERLLLHILNAGINFWLEADPERPVFTPYVTPARKLLGDNPDALYFFAPVREGRSYRIRGNLAGAPGARRGPLRQALPPPRRLGLFRPLAPSRLAAFGLLPLQP
jgi:hypothetical protein